MEDKRRSGSVLAEVALVIVVLCMITLGAIKYGWLIYQLHYVTLAAREGARAGSKQGATPSLIHAAVQSTMVQIGSQSYDLNVDDGKTDPDMIVVTVSLSTTTAGVDIVPGLLPTPAILVGKVTMAKEPNP